MNKIISYVVLALLLTACNEQVKVKSALVTDADLLNRNQNMLTQVIIYDVFSPPVASRIYAYTSLAAYETIRFQEPSKESLVAKMHGFESMPVPEKGKNYNYLLAATKAYFTVAEKVTFSTDSLKNYYTPVFNGFKEELDKETYDNSLAFGEAVGKKILARANSDNYKQTRGMPKFLGSNETGKWRPTAPDYSDAAEPHWLKIKPLIVDSLEQIQCPAPPAFSMEKTSDFYKTVDEVYNISTHLTDEQKQIAKYWDDNPFVVEHSGHMMFANKKITPVGHWMGITSIACRLKKANEVETALAYALASSSIFDAIITCWNTKYHYQHIRPITVINESIDPNWTPFLQTPPFPEHSSGHSAISAAGATVLTHLFGSFPFEDVSELPYIGMKRNFPSFLEAAQEASISRVYGGIHYRTGVDAGAIQGKSVAEYAMQKLLTKTAVAHL
jgi:hypothetical protein